MSTYQTHVFAPPVTGAPGAMRRSKLPLGSASQPTLESPPSLAQIPTAPPAVTVSAPLAEVASEPVRTGSTFPGTNAQGQRICRQCGLPGRYKDGKCVEKWGPGPEGPGTVCDRCRKKMKRVERRGTLESQQQLAAQQSQSQTLPSHHPSARPPHPLQAQVTAPSVDRERERGIARSDTMPVSHGGGIGPGGTQLLSSAPGPYDRERSERSREQTRSRVEHLRKEDEHSRERELRDRERSRDSREAGGPRPGSAASGAGSGGSGTRRTPPSPPAIATLQPHADADGEDENENENESEGTDEKPPRESHVRSTSARDSPRVGPGAYGAKRASPPLSNRSADADGDAEGDVDADDDILAAVDAAEQSKSFKDEDMAD
ncbi:hypothetical protein CONPUDRAFT_81471 [Coniophora puteana RWD-64-598 SS2]|uniref:Uncharacterized protein n=1 Tax=Coniophora puteana (strain RWD-64-598) TaxID=741705 RepID=A0A5M3MRI2_CONPW|nr:uncharacterized protein CONPUDRAFT_81471 [Coniophora puteana RWD-64-598 SS2]EIW81696.1 hypothetical protein CONPUDRAFT_81471 [Coniophora puteana RWD-64-598 SS2]